MQTLTDSETILALDVGERRIGVAAANNIARLPSPLTTLDHGPQTIKDIQQLVEAQKAGALVVGLPRGLNGQHTMQTVAVEQFVAELRKILTVPLYWQDEALTSRKAEAELEARGKPYNKGDVDALSATYILEDFLRDSPVKEDSL